MGQRIFFNWKDDDLSHDINRRTLGLIDAGLYRGFDANLIAGLNLELIHSVTGADAVDLSLVAETKFGLVITKQGSIVRDDTVISLPINNNLSGDPRIDVIYLEHEYLQVVGGVAASYGVVQGTASATPVAPALVSPNKQVILGYLYIPDGTTSLTDPGVIYTKAVAPPFANDADIMYLSKNQTSTGHKILKSLSGIYQACTFTPTVPGGNLGTLSVANKGNYFEVPYSNAQEIIITDLTVTGSAFDIGTPMYFYTKQAIYLANNANFLCKGVRFIPANSGFFLVCITGASQAGTSKYIVMQAGEAIKGDYNKYRALQSLEYKTGTFILSGALNHQKLANHILVDVTAASVGTGEDILKWVLTARNTDQLGATAADEGGTTLILEFNGDCVIKHNEASPPSVEYKPILMPTGVETFVKAGGFVVLQESPTGWNLTNISDVDKNLLNLIRYKRFRGVTVVTADTVLTSADCHNLIIVTGAVVDIDVFLPLISTIDDGDSMCIVNNGSNIVNVRRIVPNSIIIDGSPSAITFPLYTSRSFIELAANKTVGAWNLVNLSNNKDEIVHQLYVAGAGYSNPSAALGTIKYTAAILNYKSWYDTTTGRFTPQIPGWYECNFNAMFSISTGVPAYVVQLHLNKNGAQHYFLGSENDYNGGFKSLNLRGSCFVYFNGSTDYAEISYAMTNPAAVNIDAGSFMTWKFSKSLP